MTPRALAAIAFGSNLGDRARHVERAIARIGALDGVSIRARSSARETDPAGGPPQGRFLNGVVLVETTLSPRELLDALLEIERAGGRIRSASGGRNEPRTIDLDLLFHADAVIDEAGLTIPHPRLHLRDFVLEPLAEVAPAWRHPRLGRTARELLESLRRGEAAREREEREAGGA